MTLVVARQINNEVYLLADTKYIPTIESATSSSHSYKGGLKLVILTPGLCVGFAGNTEFSRRAMEGIYDKEVNLFDKNQVIKYFLDFHLASQNDDNTTDFIIALILECDDKNGGYIKEIFKIANSKVNWENVTAYIGDSDAYSCFQEILHEGNKKLNVPTFEITSLGINERPAFNQSLSNAMHAMQGVIDNTNVLTVDGIRTVVISDKDQFRYVEYIQIRGIPIPVNNESNAPVSFGGVAEGSYHKHVGMYSAVGHGIFPVYWITGGFGVIYNPEKCFEPAIFSNITQDDFRLMVEDKIAEAHQRALNYQNRF